MERRGAARRGGRSDDGRGVERFDGGFVHEPGLQC